jgi:hypothetical protein
LICAAGSRFIPASRAHYAETAQSIGKVAPIPALNPNHRFIFVSLIKS